MRTKEFINVRIDKLLADKADAAASLLGAGISRNFIIEEAARAVLAMIDAPEARVLPKIVQLVDAARAAEKASLPISSAPARQRSALEKANQLTREAGRSAKQRSKKA